MQTIKSIKFGLAATILFLLIINVPTYSTMCLNDSAPTFTEPERTEIENSVTLGAYDLLVSYSETLLMLKEFEITPEAQFNTAEALLKTESAIKQLESSMKKYDSALILAEKASYDQIYKKKLNDFDYSASINSEGLNGTIAEESAAFLKKNDVKGLYKKHMEKLNGLLTQLKNVRESLYVNKKPSIPVCWKLLQKYAEVILFGNYATVLSKKAFK